MIAIDQAELPVVIEGDGVQLRMAEVGELTVSWITLAAGVDLGPALVGLPGDLCPCPHWGYVLKGAGRVTYTDGREEVIRTGEIFYLPPGHTAIVEDNLAMVEFSPQREYDEVLEHIGRKAQG